MASEPDDNTLDNAGEVGRELAGKVSESLIKTIDGFPGAPMQRAAIAHLIANNLNSYAEEVER